MKERGSGIAKPEEKSLVPGTEGNAYDREDGEDHASRQLKGR